MKKQRMKTLALGLLVSLLARGAFASTGDSPKHFEFVFHAGQQAIKISESGKTYEEAFEKAAKDCFSQLGQGRKLSEDTGLAIIDVCANPRAI